jgi:hypothetical protein
MEKDNIESYKETEVVGVASKGPNPFLVKVADQITYLVPIFQLNFLYYRLPEYAYACQ